MTRIVKIGAPGLTGKDACQLVAQAFADAQYPLTVTVHNHMPRDVVFPEVPGLFLRHVAHATDSVKSVRIDSADLFQRVASSIEQVAELNGYQLAVTIADGDIPADEGGGAGNPDGADTSGNPGGAGDEASGGADKVAPRKPSEGLTSEQLKDALKARGIEFQANAKKAALAALLDAAPAGDADAGQTGAADAGQPAGA